MENILLELKTELEWFQDMYCEDSRMDEFINRMWDLYLKFENQSK